MPYTKKDIRDAVDRLPHLRHDSGENAFFARQLEQIRPRTYDVKYPNLKLRDFVPVDNSADPGVEQVTYRQYDQVGVAIFLANYATDLPRADVKGTEFTAKVRGIGSSYGYSIQEIRAAKFAGLPLEQRKANAARRAVEQKIDKAGSLGDTPHGITGFLGLSNTTSYTVGNGAQGSALWLRKTPDEVVKDLNGIANNIVATTYEVEYADTILVPTAQYSDIATRRMGDGSDTTILKFFLANHPTVKSVMPWYRLTGAGANGTDRMVCYRRDPDVLQLIIPQEFEMFPPQAEGLEFVTACHARLGGVQCFYPLAVSFGDGV